MHHFKVHGLVVFSVFTRLCNHHHYLIPGHLRHPPKKPFAHEHSLAISLGSWQPHIRSVYTFAHYGYFV